MRTSAQIRPFDYVPMFCDTVGSVALTTAPVAFDYPANAALMYLSAGIGFMLHGTSTQAAAPTGNSSGTTASSMLSEYIAPTSGVWRQITGGSTGYSVCASTAGGTGVLTINFFRK